MNSSFFGLLTTSRAISTTAGGAAETKFVLSLTGGQELSIADTTQYGYQFTVGGAGITITQLGVRRVAGTSADITVKLFSSDGITELASAVCDYDSVAVGEVAYTAITSVVVAASAVRHIRLVNSNYNDFQGATGSPESALSTTAVATINNESQYDGITFTITGGVSAYVDFKYTT